MKIMKILSRESFTITPGESGCCVVAVNGRQTLEKLEGVYLEWCVELGGRYLLFLTDDVPNEDQLHIHLLSPELALLDSATIGSMYATGSFRDPKILDDNRLCFHFIGGFEWHLTVLNHSLFKLPLVSSPKGVSRKHWFRQWFTLDASSEAGH